MNELTDHWTNLPIVGRFHPQERHKHSDDSITVLIAAPIYVIVIAWMAANYGLEILVSVAIFDGSLGHWGAIAAAVFLFALPLALMLALARGLPDMARRRPRGSNPVVTSAGRGAM